MSTTVGGMANDLVATIAASLARADASTAPDASHTAMRALVEQLGADIAFLRLNDHGARITTAYAEWPRRFVEVGIDPLAVVGFDDGSQIFAMQEHLKELVVLGSELREAEFVRLVAAANGKAAATAALMPVLTYDGTTAGVVGLAYHDDHEWRDDELHALAQVAPIFALAHSRFTAEERLSRAIDRDALTRLPDRHGLLTYLGNRLATGGDAPLPALSVAFADVEMIKDRLGPDAADEFVLAIAERFRAALLGSATVFRTAAAEFVVVPLRTNTSGARRMADALHVTLAPPLTIHGDVVVPRVSIGIATALPDIDTPATLVRGLGQALKHAQAEPGDRVTVLNSKIVRSAGRRNEIELSIRAAIEDDSLNLRYQPEVDLRTRTIVGMEALVRWRHPVLGDLLPDTFLDVVESLNLATELGDWVLRTACADLARWRSEGLGTNAVLRVNVSPRQLTDAAFVDTVLSAVTDCGLGAGSLCIELTESVVLHDLDAVRAIVERLKHGGVSTAIDDFGTGYSGFTQLKALPVDAVKIDRSFVRDVDANLHDRAIVVAITTMAAAFGIDVIAEGVETDGSAAALLELGCTYAQGYLFSAPVAANDMRRLLDEQRSHDSGALVG